MTELYRGMDRKTLDREYNARATVPDIEPYLADYARLSEEARRSCHCLTDVSFGQNPDETVDLFPAGQDAPLFVFIHGGYWRMLSKNESSFMAPNFVANGIAVAAINYSLVPHVRLTEIVRQVRASIAFLWREADRFGIDRDRIVVSGSSAGGHLTGACLMAGWHNQLGVPDSIIAGAVPISGIFDLTPIRHSFVNDWVHMDDDEAAANGPMNALPEAGGPLITAWGGAETSEFARQSRDYAAAWQARGLPAEAFEVTDRNHFDIPLDLCDPERELTRKVFRLIEGLGG